MKKVRVLMVCMGNICRSPTAQGVFEHVVRQAGLEDVIEIDSAGTYAYHVGQPPDQRASEAALRRGFDLSSQTARKVTADDFERFDYVLAMDAENFRDLEAICPSEHQDKIKRFLEFVPSLGVEDVPDPYYGGATGFERVLDLTESASMALLEDIRKRYGLG